MIAVIDANIALALVLDLAYSTKARRAMEQATSMIAPDLIIHETANALWRIATAEPTFASQTPEIMKAMSSLYEDVIPGNQLAVTALELAINIRHPAYDCFYIALASKRGATLVTADKKLAAAAGRASPQTAIILVE